MLDRAWGGGSADTYTAPHTISIEKLGIGFAFLTLTVLAYYRNVNWDEFYFLSRVHAWVDGRLDRSMQTGFVHGFQWVTWIPGYEATQIFAARLVMILCLATTTLSVHRITRHLTSPRAADFAALAFLCSGYVLAHGGSFRADPIAAALLTSSLAIGLTTRLRFWHMLVSAGLLACAFIVTIKSALYLPAFLAILLWRIDDRAYAIRLVVTGILALGFAVGLYLWHASGITPTEGNETSTNAKSALTTALLNGEFFPRANVILSWALFSVPQLILVGIGLASARRSRLMVVLILFAAPILSVVIYRNAFPYFFPFAAPTLMVAAALGFERVSASRQKSLMLVMLVCAALQLVLIAPENARTQRATIAEVHRLFDKPVPYIDAHSMIGSFPSASFFMSSWGVERYRAADEPILADAIVRERPPLLLVHRKTLGTAMWSQEDTYGDNGLLPEDRAALRAAYVHYSGSIWLAGTEAELTTQQQTLSVPFAGGYRVETDRVVKLNGESYSGGDVIMLDQTQVIAEGEVGTDLRLIWNTNVQPLATGALGQIVYVGFGRLVF